MVHIVDKLREDHARFAELFEKIRQSTDGSADRRGNLARSLGRVLTSHTAFEEAVFYPALREGGDEATEMVAEAASEQHAAERLLDRIEKMDPASAEFTAAIQDLETAVRTHVEREENHIFPLAMQVIGHYEAEEMSERRDAMAQADV